MKKQLYSFSLDDRYSSLGNEFLSPVSPTGLINPIEVIRNQSIIDLLGFEEGSSATINIGNESFVNVFSGNASFLGYEPVAQLYAGHQYGNFNPFLGDGRSAIIGEIITKERTADVQSPLDYWQLSVKGIGLTPFSHNGDGYAGLKECLHEYDCSRRLIELNVPSASMLCVLKGERQVYRQGFNDSAMLTRVAPSFVRFGTFEMFYFQRNVKALTMLADHIIHYYYNDSESFEEKKYAHFFKQVVIKTAQLIAHWQSVGFVHGMMNSDNQSILGITMDFGSGAFTTDFDNDFVSADSDENGRYAFGQQPIVGLWNCNVLARALSPIIDTEDLKQGLLCYETAYLEHYELLTG